MVFTNVPDDATVFARFEIVKYLTPDGDGMGYSVDSMDAEEAIGNLLVVLDRLRDARKYLWDTCPGCGEPWHGDEEEEDVD